MIHDVSEMNHRIAGARDQAIASLRWIGSRLEAMEPTAAVTSIVEFQPQLEAIVRRATVVLQARLEGQAHTIELEPKPRC